MSDDIFLPRGVREERVRDLARLEARTSHLVFRALDGFEVAISERIVARAVAIGESDAPLEWLGQLVGSRYRDDQGRHLVVEAIVRDVDAKREPHFVSSTLASEGRTRALAREQYPDAVVVGWIHGHVRHGARYSRPDFKNQATWTDPDSIGIVVDPWDPRRLAVYRGPNGEFLTLVVEKKKVRAPNTPSVRTPAPTAPTAPPSRREGKSKRSWGEVLRLGAFCFFAEGASFGTGAWMGKAESRIVSIERRLRAAVPTGPNDAANRVGRSTSRQPADGAEDLLCRAPLTHSHAVADAPRNDRARLRMKRSDTKR